MRYLILKIVGVIEKEEGLKKATMYHDWLLISCIAITKSLKYSVSPTFQFHQSPAALLRAIHHLHAGKRQVGHRPHPVHGEALLRRRVGAAAHPP